MEGLFFNVNN
ncbi:unnamed protein product, partial [Diplocarpon coronariae]